MVLRNPDARERHPSPSNPCSRARARNIRGRRLRPLWVLLALSLSLAGADCRLARGDEISVELLIVGGTESACAAAVQAARMGVPSIVLVNDIDWLGGQFSAEALCAVDESADGTGVRHNPPIPRNGLFKEVTDRIAASNLRRYGRREPGNTRVITTCRPRQAEQIFRDMMRPYIESGQLRIFSHYEATEAELAPDGKTLRGIRFQSLGTDIERVAAEDLLIRASVTIDATDWGDVIKAAGAEYEFGPDLKAMYGEPLAPESRDGYPITDMNPITYNMLIVETDRYEPIPRPEGYDPRNYRGNPYPQDPLWLYASRRLVDRYAYPEIGHPDVVLLCFAPFDYPLDVLPQGVVESLERDEPGASRRNIVQMTRRQRQIIFEDAKLRSLGFLYYLQTEVHDSMPDKTHSFRRFRLTDEFGTPDAMPPKPYLRESLRLRALYMMRQQDSTGFRDQATHFAQVMYHDGVGTWQFEYDFHPTGRRFLDDDPSGPWHNYFRPNRTWGPPFSGRALLALRSLVPQRVDGLIGAQKNLGFTSLVSAALRLHDHGLMVGQAAGAAAAVAIRHGMPPRAIPFDMARLAEVRDGLCARLDGGQPLALWPYRDLNVDHPSFEAVNHLAVRQALPLELDQVDFHPERPAEPAWRDEVVRRSLRTKLCDSPPEAPVGSMTRGAFALRWWNAIRHLPERPAVVKQSGDADADGIPDHDDAQPLDADNNNRMDQLEDQAGFQKRPHSSLVPAKPEERGLEASLRDLFCCFQTKTGGSRLPMAA